MAILKFGLLTRTKRAQVIEPRITDGFARLYTGTPPASVDTALSGGNVLAATVNIPVNCLDVDTVTSDTTLVGSWTGTGDAALVSPVTVTFYRIYDDDNVVEIQGDVTATGGGGSMTMASTTVMANQALQVTSFTKPEPNA